MADIDLFIFGLTPEQATARLLQVLTHIGARMGATGARDVMVCADPASL